MRKNESYIQIIIIIIIINNNKKEIKVKTKFERKGWTVEENREREKYFFSFSSVRFSLRSMEIGL